MLQGSDEHPVVCTWFPAPGDSVGNDRGRVLPFSKFTQTVTTFTSYVHD
jgi:hypothetical protein